ncbi:polysaccharide biosynthesis tyrosine autokinase [Geminicoccaceae bacterium 1502E]|nr:polysaccharide biosynthesis tyrosine autokinase [Geminicoccaceae bacterium 1502E]
MARGDIVKSDWQSAELVPREVGRILPTMADSGEIDFRSVLRTIARRKWTMALIMATIMSGTALWIARATPYYSADALIVVETRPSSIVRVDEAVQEVISDKAKVNTEVAVLRSRSLATRVIRELGLDRDPDFAPEESIDGDPAGSRSSTGHLRAFASLAEEAVSEVRDLLAGARSSASSGMGATPDRPGGHVPAPDGAEEAREAAIVLDRFLKSLTVESEEGSRLIRIGFTSTTPAKAALIANKLVDSYIESQLETKTEGARRAAAWLEARLAELGETVRLLERDVQQQRALTGSDGIDIALQGLAQRNASLVQAQTAAAEARGRYEQVRTILQGRGNVDALPGIIASPNVQALRARQTELLTRLAQLQTSYGDRHPQVLDVRAELAGIGQRLKREIGNILTGMHNEMDVAEKQEAALRDKLEEATREMFELRTADAAIGQTAQRLEANQGLYRNLLERYTEVVALRDNQQADVRIISSAQVPLAPSFPNAPKLMVLSLVGSASLAVLFLVATERLRQSLDTLENVERQIGLPVIGAIPELPRFCRMRSTPVQYMQRNPLSVFGRALQRLHALLSLTNSRQMPRTVLVTSASPEEGKTTVAVCLAIASVLSGEKVLLVDCNFRRPQVHRMMGVRNERGLIDILKGSASLAETITTASGYPFFILPTGQSEAGAADFLNARHMEVLLERLQKVFDVIILDSAPVQEVSNSLVLAGLAEKTVLVTRRERATRRSVSSAARQLELSGAILAGIVFNGASVTEDVPA